MRVSDDLIIVSTVTKTVVLAKMPIMSEFHTDRFFLCDDVRSRYQWGLHFVDFSHKNCTTNWIKDLIVHAL